MLQHKKPQNKAKRMVLFKRVVAGSLLLCLTGCTQFRSSRSVRRTRFPTLTEEERARIHDISFPLGVEPTKLSFTEKQLVLSFKTELSQDKLNEIYRKGMEYWGWERLGNIKAAESCMTFSKPSKICMITFRNEGFSTRVVIFTTVKQGIAKFKD